MSCNQIHVRENVQRTFRPAPVTFKREGARGQVTSTLLKWRQQTNKNQKEMGYFLLTQRWHYYDGENDAAKQVEWNYSTKWKKYYFQDTNWFKRRFVGLLKISGQKWAKKIECHKVTRHSQHSSRRWDVTKNKKKKGKNGTKRDTSNSTSAAQYAAVHLEQFFFVFLGFNRKG